MGQSQRAQRRLFQPLQDRAQKLSQGTEAGDKVVVRAEDDGPFAEALQRLFAAISSTVVYRSLYFFTQARSHGQAGDEIAYLAANNQTARHCQTHPSPLKLIPILTDENLP